MENDADYDAGHEGRHQVWQLGGPGALDAHRQQTLTAPARGAN